MIIYKIDIPAALKAAGITTTYIRKHKLLSESTMQKLRSYDTSITLSTLDTLCNILNKDISDIIEIKKGE